jgi:hypothetical protein
MDGRNTASFPLNREPLASPRRNGLGWRLCREAAKKKPISRDHRTERWENHDLPQFGIVESWVYFPILYRLTI